MADTALLVGLSEGSIEVQCSRPRPVAIVGSVTLRGMEKLDPKQSGVLPAWAVAALFDVMGNEGCVRTPRTVEGARARSSPLCKRRVHC